MRQCFLKTCFSVKWVMNVNDKSFCFPKLYAQSCVITNAFIVHIC